MSKSISFSIAKGKYVLVKEGVHFALTLEQIEQLGEIVADIDKFVDPTNSEYYKKDTRNN